MNFYMHTYIGYTEQLISKTITICEEDKQYTITEDIPNPLCAHPLKETTIQEHKSRFSTCNYTTVCTYNHTTT